MAHVHLFLSQQPVLHLICLRVPVTSVLHLSYSEENANGEMASPSRFLQEIPRHCLHRTERLDTLSTNHASASLNASGSTSMNTTSDAVPLVQQQQQQTEQLEQQQLQLPKQPSHAKSLQQLQHSLPMHLQQENERPDCTATGVTTAAATGTGHRYQQVTLDSLLPQHAARAGRLEEAALRPTGSLPLRQGPHTSFVFGSTYSTPNSSREH
jgi:hypothetical protein